jgi:hypothetical protein
MCAAGGIEVVAGQLSDDDGDDDLEDATEPCGTTLEGAGDALPSRTIPPSSGSGPIPTVAGEERGLVAAVAAREAWLTGAGTVAVVVVVEVVVLVVLVVVVQ